MIWRLWWRFWQILPKEAKSEVSIWAIVRQWLNYSQTFQIYLLDTILGQGKIIFVKTVSYDQHLQKNFENTHEHSWGWIIELLKIVYGRSILWWPTTQQDLHYALESSSLPSGKYDWVSTHLTNPHEDKLRYQTTMTVWEHDIKTHEINLTHFLNTFSNLFLHASHVKSRSSKSQ